MYGPAGHTKIVVPLGAVSSSVARAHVHTASWRARVYICNVGFSGAGESAGKVEPDAALLFQIVPRLAPRRFPSVVNALLSNVSLRRERARARARKLSRPSARRINFK